MQVSYIGYVTKDIKITSTTNNLSIKLAEDTETLDEVVVVGYGVQKKVNLTGAVASVDFEEQTKSRPITTVSSALAGLSPGLQASSGSAMPGEDNTTLRVRGVGTMNTASPLVIIDGMEGSLNAVNPLDVENISILKDAASCAIYGARAANGVILVTTKTGTRDKISINYSGRISFNSPTRMIKMMSNYADYMELMNESYRNVGKSDDLFDQKYIDLWREKSKDPNGLNENGVPNYIAYPNTDWAEELFSGGVIHDHNLSVSGGSDKIRFLLSAGYQDNEGVVDNTANKRYSMRANIEANPTKWLTVGTRTYASQMDREVGDFSNANNFLRQSTAGTYPYWNGSYGYPECPDERATANNPLYKLARNDGFKRYNRFNTTLFSKIKFFEDLSWDFNFNYNRYIYETRQHGVPAYQTRFSDGVIVDGITPPSQLSTSFDYESNYSYTLENLINYHHTFAQKHDVSALLGYQEFYKNYYKVNAAKKGLIDESLNQFDEATEMTSIGGSTEDYATRSYFGRVNYAYDSRYLFEANFRYDGSSRFHKDHRWGFFPSLSGAWRISEEGFMKDFDFFQNLKLRVGYGTSGNNNVDNNMYATDYGSGHYGYNGSDYITLVPGATLGNKKLKWEKTTTTNIGLDVSIFNSRVNLSVDWYNNESSNLLIKNKIPTSTGYTHQFQNIGSIRNRGVELVLNTTNIRTKDFSWTMDFNIAFNRSKVLDIYGDGETDNFIAEYESRMGFKIEEGKPLGQFFGLIYDGIYTTDDFVQNADGGYTLKNGIPYLKGSNRENVKPGDAKYRPTAGEVDADGNPVWGTNDRTVIGNAAPDFIGGWNNTFTYKGFDLTIFMNFVVGNDVFSMSTQRFIGPYLANQNTLEKMKNRFTLIDPSTGKESTDLARLATLNPHQYSGDALWNISGNNKTAISERSSYYLEDGSYLRLNTITLGYTLPKKLVQRAKISNARVYCTLNNIHTFTGYTGYDPEVSASSSALTPGIDNSSYPRSKSWVVGVNLTF